MDKWNIRIAIGVAVLVVAIFIAGLMYAIHTDYEKKRLDEKFSKEQFAKTFANKKELECWLIYRDTGYLPRYCL